METSICCIQSGLDFYIFLMILGKCNSEVFETRYTLKFVVVNGDVTLTVFFISLDVHEFGLGLIYFQAYFACFFY
jgi:hypothetical protein